MTGGRAGYVRHQTDHARRAAYAGTHRADARPVAGKDASNDKTAAQYKVEQEKCDAFAGDAKAACLDRAKVNFGKP